MAARNNAISASPTDSYPEELVLKRTFDAPRDLVWKAWTDPAHLSQWWGPKGFTSPRCEWEARPGGKIHIDMRGPDGTVHPMSGVMKEVMPPERLVFLSSALDENGKSMFDVLATATFAEQSGKTTLTLELRVLTATARAPQYLKGMEMGWKMSLDRLAEHVARHSRESSATLAGDLEILATRVFDAPRDLVWQMWTTPEHIVNWWGPQGFRTTIQEMDVREGGTWRMVMHGPDGRDYNNRIIYVEVVKPERLVYRHTPEHGSEPVSFETTVTFAAEGERTRIHFRMLFPTTEQRDHVVKTYGAVEGLNQTLGRFGEYAAAKGRTD
jgi:uncharacterized protein YndB with AHSA1/START domain